jgi:serine/threonine protein kinase
MAGDPSWVAKRAKGRPYAELAANAAIAPHVQNVFPLSGLVSNANWRGRVTSETKGSGTFGRANAEVFGAPGSVCRVVTKYSLRDDRVGETAAEIATLRYFKGLPNVAQLVGITDRNAAGAPTRVPALLMGCAQSSLTERSLYRSWDDVLHTVIGILQGYDTMHSLGMVHRDTKPGNMLMTALKEVWVTDFGASRYTNPVLPACQDGYTGTIWYTSPEVILKDRLKARRIPVSYTNEGWRAHDAWGVGAALYEILMMELVKYPGMYESIFYGDTVSQVLLRIYSVKGAPVAADGELFRLHQQYQPYNPNPLAPGLVAQNPRAVIDRVLSRTVHQPSPDRIGELETIAQIINGLLDYNPARRLTIRGALDMLVDEGMLEPEDLRRFTRPTLFDHCRLPASAAPAPAPDAPADAPAAPADAAPSPVFMTVSLAEQKAEIQMLFEWTYERCRTMAVFAPGSRHFIFDRACIYLLSILNKGSITLDTLQGYGIAAVVIASELFNQPGFGLSVRDASHTTASKYSPGNIKWFVNKILMESTAFLGETFFDRLMMAAESEAQKRRAAQINTLCFSESLYTDFAATLSSEQILTYLVSFMKSEAIITPEALVAEARRIAEEAEAGAREVTRELNRMRLLRGNISVLRRTAEGGRRRPKSRKRTKTRRTSRIR